jgi:hypothetical protein
MAVDFLEQCHREASELGRVGLELGPFFALCLPIFICSLGLGGIAISRFTGRSNVVASLSDGFANVYFRD